ncbi:S8 family serine peptidase [Methylococcus sp. EFPC2]|uniref:S8 family peptidase n=1 Tax=Methylococcus sp. EFPC2 TaxID=2812648 RepID=UPI001966D4C9|nr:S8 family serine peptidase [Methylococcus sp. EFPC2]QSA97986.1 S8 family serine peptidase [Methylococcus sp. EFPC2]
MTTLMRALLLALMIPWSGCALQTEYPALDEPSVHGEDRRILVTFVDHSIGRVVPGGTQDRYLPRGPYASSSWSSRLAGELAERYRLRLVAEWPVTVLGVACVVYEVPAGQNVDEALQTLAKDQQVESVQAMQTFHVMGGIASSAANHDDPYYRLQKDMQAMNVEAAHRFATGRGVRVAVIDSGVDTHHPDLRRQIAVAENLAILKSGEETRDVHGTAVAGVIAAQAGNGLGIMGVAPEVELYALRACWPESPGAAAALCNSFTLALAVNEAIRLGAQIINFSLSGPDDPLVARLIRAAIEKGILIVASDSGGNAVSGFPASVDGVIAVRSQSPEPMRGGFRGGGLSAPGSEILTTLPHATYDFMSGNSFAAPHITGLLALMHELKPDLTATEALAVLRQRVPRRAVPNGVPYAARPHLRDGYCLRRPSRPPSTRSSDLRAVASASLRDDSTACSGCLAGHLRTQ